MKILGNILWFVFGGFISGLGWILSGLIWCITVIGIPYGVQCFKCAKLSFFPFGKEIVYGDLSKFTATSNIAETGGGARDLRFSPSDEFLPIFERMFPDRQGSFNVGKFYWPNGKETDVKIARPTRSRANEMRICTINQCFPPEYYPTDAEDQILLLVYDDELKVTPYFTSRESLKNEEWDPIIRSKILQGLDAERGARHSAMGYLDIENDNFYTNGRINSDY